MARFKPNQKVVCTADDNFWILGKGPKYGDIVTVERYSNSSNRHMYLSEYAEYGRNSDGNLGRRCFDEQYFEPLADISELESILKEQPEHV